MIIHIKIYVTIHIVIYDLSMSKITTQRTQIWILGRLTCFLNSVPDSAHCATGIVSKFIPFNNYMLYNI